MVLVSDFSPDSALCSKTRRVRDGRVLALHERGAGATQVKLAGTVEPGRVAAQQRHQSCDHGCVVAVVFSDNLIHEKGDIAVARLIRVQDDQRLAAVAVDENRDEGSVGGRLQFAIEHGVATDELGERVHSVDAVRTCEDLQHTFAERRRRHDDDTRR